MLFAGQGQGPGSKACPGGCPENYNLEHLLVWEPLPIAVTAARWDNATDSAVIRVTGTRGKLVTLRVLDGVGMFCPYDQATQQNIWQPGCYFYPEKYHFQPASGVVPFEATLARKESAAEKAARKDPTENSVMILATMDGTDVAAVVRCIGATPEFGGPNCK